MVTAKMTAKIMPTHWHILSASDRSMESTEPIKVHSAKSTFGISRQSSVAMIKVNVLVVNHRNTKAIPANVATDGNHHSICHPTDHLGRTKIPTYRSVMKMNRKI